MGAQQVFWTDGPSLESAKREFEEGLDDGITCPCCNRYGKRYKRTIYDTMARVLIRLCQKSDGKVYYELRRSQANGGDYAKLAYWGLVEAHPDKAKLYRPTPKGYKFVRGKISVPRYCHVYNDVPSSFSGEPMTIHDCLGEEFDFDAMMCGQGGIPKLLDGPPVGLAERVAGGAVFSPCRTYRYRLWNRWDAEASQLGFVALNPSIADGEKQWDTTARKFEGFARRLGYGGWIAGNLFGLVSTDPAGLTGSTDPVGPENDEHLRYVARHCDRVIVCWGGDAANYPDRVRDVVALLRQETDNLCCLGRTQAGFPRHTSRIAYSTPLEVYT